MCLHTSPETLPVGFFGRLQAESLERSDQDITGVMRLSEGRTGHPT
jgi:hypothetical protein